MPVPRTPARTRNAAGILHKIATLRNVYRKLHNKTLEKCLIASIRPLARQRSRSRFRVLIEVSLS
jgi:hypothetical protein